jgi:hypothetical protein
MEFNEDDIIYNQEVEPEYLPEDTILVNNEEFVIKSFVKSKPVSDKLGFPANYFWYKAENESGEIVNIFIFDSDIDSVEPNDKVAERWFNTVYNNSVNSLEGSV